MNEWLPLGLFLFTLFFLLLGFPVAFTLGGASLLFAGIGFLLDAFDPAFLEALPVRLYGMMNNETLIAIPLFIFMGITLEKSEISKSLLETMAEGFGPIRGGLGVSVFIVGALLAASTGIVGATVVTMGLISLPAMLSQKYSPKLASGIICASGTLGQIIPPSIVLIILGDVMSSAYQQSQLEQGIFSPETVSVADLFVGAILPGFLLVFLYISWVFLISWLKPDIAPSLPLSQRKPNYSKRVIQVLLPPLILITGVLGSILMGITTPTEAASVGCIGALLLAGFKQKLTFKKLKQVFMATTEVTSMVFTILIGASLFSLVFRGFSGDEWIRTLVGSFEGSPNLIFFLIMTVIFILGFFLDFFEIVFVVVPVVGPLLLNLGMDPTWLGVMIALNLQTSFLTPPFGFSLFYLRGVAPAEIKTTDIYAGVIPFIGIQILVLLILWKFPELATFLPNQVF
ncbi:MAG: C4-dicarboxylate ABC transporter [Bdellovibrionaceae bacterium]|nr:C4-dicarboxylate ABC transporter [Pseudobdellovibrionaceae bacterium]|tara:strand:+ start:1857 stop:3227 length:1371 start_codon:yes stop_codon:yes gene_type:complete